MLQSQRGNSLGYTARFIEIDRRGLAFGNSTEAATPCTQISQQHERCRAMIPAFSDIGTLRRLADGMQIEAARQLLELVIVLAHRGTSFEPAGLRLGRRPRQFDLNEFGKGGRHPLFYCTKSSKS